LRTIHKSILSSLHVLQSAGIVHTDVKAKNYRLALPITIMEALTIRTLERDRSAYAVYLSKYREVLATLCQPVSAQKEEENNLAAKKTLTKKERKKLKKKHKKQEKNMKKREERITIEKLKNFDPRHNPIQTLPHKLYSKSIWAGYLLHEKRESTPRPKISDNQEPLPLKKCKTYGSILLTNFRLAR